MSSIRPLCALAAALAVWLPFLPFFFGNENVFFNALTADVHYYARMARFFTEIGFFSFDGQTVSNGFMPLWQIVTAALDLDHVAGETPDVLLKEMFVTSLLLTGLAMAGLAWFVARRTSALSALLVVPLLVPGALYWIAEALAALGVLSANQVFYSIWSYANGMESCLGLALFAVWLPVAARLLSPDTATPVLVFWAGLLSFLIFMARLDDVFLGVALFLGLFLSRSPNRAMLARNFAIAPILGTAAYVAANTFWAGSALPVSGLAKTVLFSLPNGMRDVALIGTNANYESRLIPILLPAAIGVLCIAVALATGRVHGSLMVVLSAYLLMKAGFLFSSVPLVHQGHWYYAVMVAAVGVIAASAVGSWLARVTSPGALAAVVGISALALGTSVIRVSQSLSQLKPDTYAYAVAALCERDSPVRSALQQELKIQMTTGIVDTADGVYAYCLDAPALTVTGLGDSVATSAAISQQGFAEFAVSGGYDLVVESEVPAASYNWRSMIGDWRAEQVAESGPVRVWRFVAPAD